MLSIHSFIPCIYSVRIDCVAATRTDTGNTAVTTSRSLCSRGRQGVSDGNCSEEKLNRKKRQERDGVGGALCDVVRGGFCTEMLSREGMGSKQQEGVGDAAWVTNRHEGDVKKSQVSL